MCLDVSQCNEKGFCINNECLCDVAWFGDTCHDNLKEFLPNVSKAYAFITYRVIFLLTYCIIFLFTFFRLYLKIKKEKHFFGKNNLLFMVKAMRSPYNLTMTSIFLISITRILWLAIDPFQYNDIFHRSVERLFFEATYSLIFLVYAIVLWVWYSIYEEISVSNPRRGKMRLRWFKIKVKIFVTLIVLAQLITSILKGFHDEDFRWITLAIYVILFGILVIVTLEYVIYGWLLYKCITDQEETIRDKYNNLSQSVGQTGMAAAAYQGGGPNIELPVLNEEGNSQEKPKVTSSKESQHSENDIHFESSNKKLVNNPKKVIFRSEKQRLTFQSENQIAPQEDGSSAEIQFSNNYQRSSEKNPTKTVPSLTSRAASLGKRTDSIGQDLKFEEKVKEIVERHQIYLKPVDIVEAKLENIDKETSVIIDDSDDVMWDFVDDFDLKQQQEQHKRKEDQRSEMIKMVSTMRMKTLVIKFMTTMKKNRFNDAFQVKLLNDRLYLENHQAITHSDKLIVKKILSLTVIAICLEVLFGIVTLLVFYTPILQTPGGMITSMWVTGFLEVFAIVAIIFLFSIVQTQDKENLRLIMRIGQNQSRINRLYGFILPKFLRQEESKKKLEKTINQMTARYLQTYAS